MSVHNSAMSRTDGEGDRRRPHPMDGHGVGRMKPSSSSGGCWNECLLPQSFETGTEAEPATGRTSALTFIR